MEKSATNKLSNDGLTSLKYKKLEENLFPLYTWILVEIPRGPRNKISKRKSEEKNAKSELLNGISIIGNLWKANEDNILNIEKKKYKRKKLKNTSTETPRY